MLNNMKISRNPSPYPRTLFHLIRLAQFVSSLTVMSILAFFVHYLIQDKYYIPWTFLVLLAVSSFTNISVFVTAFFYHYRTLRPRLSSLINTFLTALWAMGFTMLTWYISPLLADKCDLRNWDHETGIMVCRLYKALETFSITGLLCTAASLALDLHTIRKDRHRGVYNPMGDLNIKRGHPQHSENDDFSHELNPQDLGRDVSIDVAHPEYSHGRGSYRTQPQPIDVSKFGYAAPSEQTSYLGAGSRYDQAFDKDGA
ncbi:MAG: hypothetical protein MMC23_010157 [Stictis urceolatum]|nr:hypothetical protein [Stictis urceolata]